MVSDPDDIGDYMTAEKRRDVLPPESFLIGCLLLVSGLVSVGCWEISAPGMDNDRDGTDSDECVTGDCATDTIDQKKDTGTNDVFTNDSETSSSHLDTMPSGDTDSSDSESTNSSDSESTDISDSGFTDLCRGIFNPEGIYIHGTYSEGSCYAYVLAEVHSPNIFVGESDCGDDNPGVSPGGRYFYTGDENSFWFNPDACADGDGTLEEYHLSYTSSDDEPIADPCPEGMGHHSLTMGINGEFLYYCRDGIWRTTDGTETGIEDPMSYGYENKVLNALEGFLNDVQKFEIVDVSTGTVNAVSDETGVPIEVIPVAARATADPMGFWLASTEVLQESTQDDLQRIDQYTLWHVDNSGTATFVADYPLPTSELSTSWEAVLDPNGGLYVRGRDLTGSLSLWTDAVAYFNIDGTVKIVYTEHDNPTVKIGMHTLVTGP
jgi:hypothetical protein